jgi:hypothetical protein
MCEIRVRFEIRYGTGPKGVVGTYAEKEGVENE